MSAPLRVLHLRNSDRLGGPERLLLDQAALADSSIEPVLASFGSPAKGHPFLDAARARGLDARLVAQRGSFDPRLRRRVRHLVEDVDPAVVVSHDYKADMLSVRAVRGRPRVGVVHGYTAEGLKVRFFEAVDRRLLRRMDAVVVVSPLLRERLAGCGVEPARVHLVENGIRTEIVRAAAAEARVPLRQAWGVDADTLVLTALGRLSVEKGQDVLLESLARVHPDVGAPFVLVLVGDGAMRAALETRAQAPDLAGRVRLLGWRSDPWACLGASDAFVLPSRREGLPLALLEAMACGLPVVATRVGAVAAVLEDGAAGLLVDPEDESGLTEALREVVTNADLRRRLGEAASRRVASAYDAEGQTRRLEALYREIVAG